MKYHTLDYSCLLNANQESVCQFHTDTHNLPLITPPWVNVKIIGSSMLMILTLTHPKSFYFHASLKRNFTFNPYSISSLY